MNPSAQITIWSQRLLHGKLHLQGVITFDGTVQPARPLCGRELNNHSVQRAQITDKAEFATSEAEFLYQLLGGKACRHCAVKAGLLVRTRTIQEPESEE